MTDTKTTHTPKQSTAELIDTIIRDMENIAGPSVLRALYRIRDDHAALLEACKAADAAFETLAVATPAIVKAYDLIRAAIAQAEPG